MENENEQKQDYAERLAENIDRLFTEEGFQLGDILGEIANFTKNRYTDFMAEMAADDETERVLRDGYAAVAEKIASAAKKADWLDAAPKG